MSNAKGFGSKPPDYSYSLRLEEGQSYDFAGDQILAWVTLRAKSQKWIGWLTEADDTADGLSLTFDTVQAKHVGLLKTAKKRLREAIGREASERLGRTYSCVGSDYVESVGFLAAPQAQR